MSKCKTNEFTDTDWKSSVSASHSLRKLLMPKVIEELGSSNSSNNSIKDDDVSEKQRAKRIKIYKDSKVTVIMKPGVFAGMHAFEGSSHDLKRVRQDLNIISTTASASSSQYNYRWDNDEQHKNFVMRSGKDDINKNQITKLNVMLRLVDAQNLKFSKPDVYWAPDINELNFLEVGDEVILAIQFDNELPYHRRFRVKITFKVSEDNRRKLHSACQRRKICRLKGDVNESGIVGLERGTEIIFDTTHVFAIVESYRDRVFARYATNEMTRVNYKCK